MSITEQLAPVSIKTLVGESLNRMLSTAEKSLVPLLIRSPASVSHWQLGQDGSQASWPLPPQAWQKRVGQERNK